MTDAFPRTRIPSGLLRMYERSGLDKVKRTYCSNHSMQTVEFVDACHKKYHSFNIAQMSLWSAMEMLENMVDDSDPDFHDPQIYHAFLTAEDLRKKFPDDDWIHLCGLIHDLGKVLSLPMFGSLDQWAVVGDTFPVGCVHSEKIVYPEFFVHNPDLKDSRYNSKLGIYEANCGLSHLKMSYGHDEYLYQFLRKNNCRMPEIGMNVVRFHSFYAWHKENEYTYFMTPEDELLHQWVTRFSNSDLYSKTHLNFEKDYVESTLKPYYQSLMEKFFPNQILDW